MAQLKGSRELRARLRALKTAFKPIGRQWADDMVQIARPEAPVRTGHLRKSIRRRNATMKKATVYADYWAFFVDAGPKPHEIKPKRKKVLMFGDPPRFAPRVSHPGYAARPFIDSSARKALDRNPMAEEVIKAWNEAV